MLVDLTFFTTFLAKDKIVALIQAVAGQCHDSRKYIEKNMLQ